MSVTKGVHSSFFITIQRRVIITEAPSNACRHKGI